MMASMVAKVSRNSSQFSMLPSQEKGSRNKRKFRTDPPVSERNKVLTSVLNDGPSYEFSAERFEMTGSHEHPFGACDMCGSYEDDTEALKLELGLSNAGIACPPEVGPSRAREEAEGEEFQDADWSDLTESQLEELVMSNLDAIFSSAIKKIVDCGYSEEVATNAVMKSSVLYGPKDSVSNMVDSALAFLTHGHDTNTLRVYVEDLQQLGKYVLAELVCILRAVRPFFSNGDAMWCLLICDMNVSLACAMDSDPLSSMTNEGPLNRSPSSPQPQCKAEPKNYETGFPNPCEPTSTIPCAALIPPDMNKVAGDSNLVKPKTSVKEGSTPSSCIPLEKPFTTGVSQAPTDEKHLGSRKVQSTSSKATLRQKSFHLERSYRAFGAKGTFRTAKLSGYILDKRGKSMADAAGLNLKGASLKISKAMAMGLELAHETRGLSVSTSTSLSSSSASFTVDSRGTISESYKSDHIPAAPVAKIKPAVSTTDTELSLSLPSKITLQQPILSGKIEAHVSHSVGIPYDKSLAQWVPQDKKDEMIMKLVPRIRELQNQLQEWTEWANQKVMQAARRLSKDKGVLKTLRQEKDEVERLKKEKQALEENTMKKLSEMANALAKASGQVEGADAAVRRLKVENAALRQEMEAAKLRAADSAASCQEASKREKKTLMKFQSWEKQKIIFQEELAAERRQLSQLHQELDQAKEHYAQFEARWKQEQKLKEDLLTQANSIRKEREQLETSAKTKEGAIKLKAEAKLQKYKEDIWKLENEITQLRLKSDSSKIEALKRGIDGSYASRLTDSQTAPASKEPQNSYLSANVFQDISGTGGVKRERECVMCLSEEMSVVFLPCAHQVVCKTCNELHEKQGMNFCPSCRSPIMRRICVGYARA